jgi:hypothetical protein
VPSACSQQRACACSARCAAGRLPAPSRVVLASAGWWPGGQAGGRRGRPDSRGRAAGRPAGGFAAAAPLCVVVLSARVVRRLWAPAPLCLHSPVRVCRVLLLSEYGAECPAPIGRCALGGPAGARARLACRVLVPRAPRLFLSPCGGKTARAAASSSLSFQGLALPRAGAHPPWLPPSFSKCCRRALHLLAATQTPLLSGRPPIKARSRATCPHPGPGAGGSHCAHV